MKAFGFALSVCTVGLLLAACGGQVDIARTAPADSGPGGDDADLPGDDSGIRGDGGGVRGDDASIGSPQDAGIDDDGFSGAAGEASAPPPACTAAALACGESFPGATNFASSQDAANALVGRWSFCGQSNNFYPADQAGEEYAADGTYYELVTGPGGQLQRNTDPTTIGNWEVALGPHGEVSIHTFDGGVQRSGGLSDCPPSLVLMGVEARLP